HHPAEHHQRQEKSSRVPEVMSSRYPTSHGYPLSSVPKRPDRPLSSAVDSVTDSTVRSTANGSDASNGAAVPSSRRSVSAHAVRASIRPAAVRAMAAAVRLVVVTAIEVISAHDVENQLPP